MNKEDMIYDIVCRLEEKMDIRLNEQECRISILEKFKTKILAISGFITLVGSVMYNFIKDFIR